MLIRGIEKVITSRLDKQKITLLIGARRVGKTALLDMIVANNSSKKNSSIKW
jgi:predicted AAA+ superfamily ATPase